jgi:hypothetical protein
VIGARPFCSHDNDADTLDLSYKDEQSSQHSWQDSWIVGAVLYSETNVNAFDC